MAEKTNADRARRFENAMRHYIEYTGDSIKANEPDVWMNDLLCDARHWADAMGFEFHPNMGRTVYEAEVEENDTGKFVRLSDWLPNSRRS